MVFVKVGPFRSRDRAGGLFPPQDPECEAMIDLLRRSPEQYGHERSTWTITMIRETALFDLSSYSGTYKRLRRWKISRKQTRLHIHSPDAAYDQKVQAI